MQQKQEQEQGLSWLWRELFSGALQYIIYTVLGVSLILGLIMSTWGFFWNLPAPVLGGLLLSGIPLAVMLVFLKRKRTARGQQPYIEFYDSRIEKGKPQHRGSLIDELTDSSEVWISMIAGSQIRESLSILDKFTKIIINDPESEQMKRIVLIQPQGEDFVGLAKAAIRICQEKKGKKDVLHLSENFVLNVVISDPHHKTRAWARVQTFLPHKHGDVSPSYVVEIKDRPELFKVIKGD